MTGRSSSRRAASLLEQLESADEAPRRATAAAPGSFGRTARRARCERAGARLALALARQLGDAPRVARREAVPDPVVSLGARAAAFEPDTRVWATERCHAATVGRRASRPPQAVGAAPKGFLKIPPGRRAGSRRRARSGRTGAATDRARSSSAGARRRRAGSAPRPGTAGPHTSRSSMRWVRSLPRFCASTRSRSNSCGVSLIRSPARVTSRSATSITSSPISITGPASRREPAQHGTQPREQLVDAERLRHVVVGAGVERRDLLALLADRREHDHRRVGPGAELAADVGAAAVGQHEVEDHRGRRLRGRRAERRRGGRGRVDRVAGAAQRRRRAPAGSAARRRRRGRAGSYRRARPAPRRRGAQARRSRPGPGATRPRRGRRSPQRSRARSRGRGRRRSSARRAAGRTARRPARARLGEPPAPGRRPARSPPAASR